MTLALATIAIFALASAAMGMRGSIDIPEWPSAPERPKHQDYVEKNYQEAPQDWVNSPMNEVYY